VSSPSWTHFDPARFERHMATTTAAKAGLTGAVVVGWFASGLFVGTVGTAGLGLMLAGLFGWLIGNVVSNRTGRFAIAAAQMAAVDPASADLESTIAQGMRRFTMYRTVRVMLYHQLAVLRHTRDEHDETVAICQALLSLPNLGLSGSLRTRLLLLLGDSALHRGDRFTAWHALNDLAGRRLELIESMQMLTVQTRYELACAYHEQALRALPKKVAIAELLPPHASAEMHRMLARAAEQAGRANTAVWLSERADLLMPADHDHDTRRPIVDADPPLAGPAAL